MRSLALAALGALALIATSTAFAATAPRETRFVDKPAGFSIVLPPKWYPVPRTVAAVKTFITAAKKEKLKGVPTAYSFYLTAAGKAQLKDFVFQAFLNIYPSNNPVAPVVSIQTNAKAHYRSSDLVKAADAYASALLQNKGAKVTKPVAVKLKTAGTAEVVVALIPVGGGLTVATTFYLLIHDGKLYVLKFDADAGSFTKAVASVFRSIADNFAFV